MELTLQLVVVVVVLQAQTKFRHNFLKSTLHTIIIIIHKVGDTIWHLGHYAPFPTQLFPRNSNPNGKYGKHARIIKKFIG